MESPCDICSRLTLFQRLQSSALSATDSSTRGLRIRYRTFHSERSELTVLHRPLERSAASQR
jgi:hypothetical protein